MSNRVPVEAVLFLVFRYAIGVIIAGSDVSLYFLFWMKACHFTSTTPTVDFFFFLTKALGSSNRKANVELISPAVLHPHLQTHFISETWNTVSSLFILTLISQPQSFANTHRHTPCSNHLMKSVSCLQKMGFLTSHFQVYCHYRDGDLFLFLTEEICILITPALAYRPLRANYNYL